MFLESLKEFLPEVFRVFFESLYKKFQTPHLDQLEIFRVFRGKHQGAQSVYFSVLRKR